MSSQLVRDIKEALERYEREAPLRALQENLSDVEHLIAGRPDQCISFWPSNMNMELLEKLRQRYIAKIDAFKCSETVELAADAEEKAYLEEQKELSGAPMESPNNWIEREAELANDATIDADAIAKMIQREQTTLWGKRTPGVEWLRTIRQPDTPNREIEMGR